MSKVNGSGYSMWPRKQVPINPELLKGIKSIQDLGNNNNVLIKGVLEKLLKILIHYQILLREKNLLQKIKNILVIGENEILKRIIFFDMNIQSDKQFLKKIE